MNDVLWKESYGLYLYPHIRPKNYIMKIIGLHLYVNIRMNNVGSFSLFCIHTYSIYNIYVRIDVNF